MKIEYESLVVGSDESGTGGLFGGFSVAGFRLTRRNQKILSEHDWFKEIDDPKEMEDEKVKFLSDQIKSVLGSEDDYCILNISSESYNKLLNKFDREYQILCGFHNQVHKKLINDSSFHVLDNFLHKSGDPSREYYDSIQDEEKVTISTFAIKGEKKFKSIAIAAILATDAYLKHLEIISKDLNVCIDAKKNHEMKPKDIEPILLFLEKRGYTREQIFKKYCKKNKAEKYEKQLKPKKI